MEGILLPKEVEESGHDRPCGFPRLYFVLLAHLMPMVKINRQMLKNLVDIDMLVILFENHTRSIIPLFRKRPQPLLSPPYCGQIIGGIGWRRAW